MKSPLVLLKKAIDRYNYSVYRSKLSLTQYEDIEKIGSDYGGWYIPANLINQKSICYCVGVGEDLTFDVGLLEQYSCEVYAFDPTPRAIEHAKKLTSKNPSFFFHAWGLYTSDAVLKFYAPKNPAHVSHSVVNLQKTKGYFEAECKRLSTIMKEFSHPKLALLKLDIEGAELEVLETIIEDNLDIDILCVEFHPQLGLRNLSRVITRLNQWKYKLIKIDNWNYTFLEKSKFLS